MTLHLTPDQVWHEIDRHLFAVLGVVTPRGEARTVGVVYVVADHKLYIATQKAAWKVKHIACNPHVSLTITIVKRIPLMPWVEIPAATISFAGHARILEHREVAPAILRKLYRAVVKDEAALAASRVIEVVPQGEFLTYGVGVSLMEMRFPDKARGRAAVTPV
jgi:uncharacterized pyridoxamine 5'-phosphate oxidase family protein